MSEKYSTAQEQQLRQLALVDRVIGLEAENARLQIEVERQTQEVLNASLQWRLGGIFLAPIKLLKKIASKS